MNAKNISPRVLIKALRRMGYTIDESRAKGSHVFVLSPDGERTSAIPTSTDPLRIGTAKGILRDLGITLKDVEDAL